MKVKEFINKLNALGFTDDTELSFGFINGDEGEYYECEIRSIDDEDRRVKIREYENRYWLVKDNVYELHFTQFYDDEIILKFIKDEEDSENYIYVSDLLNVEHDEEYAESVEGAMEQFENMIVDHIQDEISYYEEMLEKFQEEKYMSSNGYVGKMS